MSARIAQVTRGRSASYRLGWMVALTWAGGSRELSQVHIGRGARKRAESDLASYLAEHPTIAAATLASAERRALWSAELAEYGRTEAERRYRARGQMSG